MPTPSSWGAKGDCALSIGRTDGERLAMIPQWQPLVSTIFDIVSQLRAILHFRLQPSEASHDDRCSVHVLGNGEEIKFLRKVAGLKALEPAGLLGVSPTSYSHWETGKHQADMETLLTIGALAADAIAGRSDTRDRLLAMREPPKERTVRLAG